ncbi:MAG: DUF3325 domain-containing protein [Pseudomonas sp.]|uniref:DUF3325 domain-containing protein n=1 Tax=Pseudomonas sp. TaxID=306 RepID=UPI002733F200|nr:DUF3325 domain-containing protein [Pseudomonas sp.]MDP3846053.1 DUF3325 domain-containing protein [Pseudomonas sp.]
MLELTYGGALLVLQLLGLSGLALAQDKHWRTVMGPALRHPQSRLRLLGWAALTLSLSLAVSGQGWAFGSLIWLLSLPPAGFAIAFTLAWRSQWLRSLGNALSR